MITTGAGAAAGANSQQSEVAVVQPTQALDKHNASSATLFAPKAVTWEPNRPVAVLCCPYLPLVGAIEFGGWWLGPLREFSGRWLSRDFEQRARQFLRSFRTPEDREIDNPALLARVKAGADGRPPSGDEQHSLEHAIAYATVDSNRPWEPTTGGGWPSVTADNADLWVQPLSLADGSIALERGGRCRTGSGGLSLGDESFRIPAPLEVPSPLALQLVQLDQHLIQATYATLVSPPASHVQPARRIDAAIHWVVRSWLNTPSLSETDRLVFLKTASEALTGESRDSRKAAKKLRRLFRGAEVQEGGGLGLDDLLWRADEPTLTHTRKMGDGSRCSVELSALEHWYMDFSHQRNAIIHADDKPPSLVYEEQSQYRGRFVETGDRVMREAIGVALGKIGYPEVWRTPSTRIAHDHPSTPGAGRGSLSHDNIHFS